MCALFSKPSIAVQRPRWTVDIPLNNDQVHYLGLEVFFESKAKSLLSILHFVAPIENLEGGNVSKVRQTCQWPW